MNIGSRGVKIITLIYLSIIIVEIVIKNYVSDASLHFVIQMQNECNIIDFKHFLCILRVIIFNPLYIIYTPSDPIFVIAHLL